MARAGLIRHQVWDERKRARWSVGTTIAYQSAIWRVQGVLIAAAPGGAPELRWVLDEQMAQGSDVGGDGENGGGEADG